MNDIFRNGGYDNISDWLPPTVCTRAILAEGKVSDGRYSSASDPSKIYTRLSAGGYLVDAGSSPDPLTTVLIEDNLGRRHSNWGLCAYPQGSRTNYYLRPDGYVTRLSYLAKI